MQFLNEINSEFEQTFKILFDLSPDGFLIADTKGKILHISLAGKQMFGLDDDDIKKGINLFDFVYNDDKERALKNNIDRIKGEYSGFSEYRVVRKDGTVFWNETNATFLKDSNGNLKILFAVFRDISSRKKQEFDLQEYANNLQEINKLKDKFFSIIAHDLKNPFNGIINLSELLIGALKDSNIDKSLKFASIIKDASVHGRNLLINLLDWARIQTGKIKIQCQHISISEILDGEIDLVQPLLMGKSVEIIKNYDNDLFVYSDKDILSTVIRNLLNNAIKYSNLNGEINIVSSIVDNSFLVSIEDNGIGICEQEQKKLFSQESVNSVPGTNKEKGTGLGLIICKDLIEMLNGNISVYSEMGIGSKFVISIPINN
jgi:two-component system, sensor histidine kinase and response regulator